MQPENLPAEELAKILFPDYNEPEPDATPGMLMSEKPTAITLEELKYDISKLARGKSPGASGIMNECLKILRTRP